MLQKKLLCGNQMNLASLCPTNSPAMIYSQILNSCWRAPYAIPIDKKWMPGASDKSLSSAPEFHPRPLPMTIPMVADPDFVCLCMQMSGGKKAKKETRHLTIHKKYTLASESCDLFLQLSNLKRKICLTSISK